MVGDVKTESASKAVDMRTRVVAISRQAAWFTVIGGVLTLAYFLMYLTLRTALGPQPANAVAWATTAIADTAANRRITFTASARISARRAQLEGLLVFAL